MTLLVVDNTFATPLNQRPLELGADILPDDCYQGVVARPLDLTVASEPVPPRDRLGSAVDQRWVEGGRLRW